MEEEDEESCPQGALSERSFYDNITGVLSSPSFVGSLPSLRVQFAVGPEGSGAPLHYHNAAWNGIAVGEKHWWMAAPSNGIMTTRSVKDTVSLNAQSLASLTSPYMYQCRQRQGDVVFVPIG